MWTKTGLKKHIQASMLYNIGNKKGYTEGTDLYVKPPH